MAEQRKIVGFTKRELAAIEESRPKPLKRKTRTPAEIKKITDELLRIEHSGDPQPVVFDQYGTWQPTALVTLNDDYLMPESEDEGSDSESDSDSDSDDMAEGTEEAPIQLDEDEPEAPVAVEQQVAPIEEAPVAEEQREAHEPCEGIPQEAPADQPSVTSQAPTQAPRVWQFAEASTIEAPNSIGKLFLA